MLSSCSWRHLISISEELRRQTPAPSLPKRRFTMGIHSQPRRIPTVSSVQDLSGVRFGHKFPRRGLKLLHWLANEWIAFDGEGKMVAKTHPRTREFGFHIFHNIEQILPVLLGSQSCYFEVGNLHADGAAALPFSVADTGSDKSNTDRIIVRMDSGQVVGEVYITEHTPHQNSFSSESTYRISRGLIRSIRGLEESVFLQWAGYIPGMYEHFMEQEEEEEEDEHLIPKNSETAVNIGEEEEEEDGRSSRDDRCCCVIL
ncbi:uncharacterized protein LOC125720284 [Brienomyrus brachyistius]|uniref:uncharacterized protein LOC125720284 n=1 Tax=Brienomyrus brachyistius TaxID=42636 RepID=UPI0020B41E91|nr:uncharacterized protein LOC125720284 [Brienomyrus brachyistius]